MRTWVCPPKQTHSKFFWFAQRNDQPSDRLIYAGTIEKLNTWLDDRCECDPLITRLCAFHKELRGYE